MVFMLAPKGTDRNLGPRRDLWPPGRVIKKVAEYYITAIPVRHESAPPLVAESATGKARPSVFRI